MTLNRVTAGRANAGWPCGCGCAQRTPLHPTDLTDEQWAVLEPLLPVMLCLAQHVLGITVQVVRHGNGRDNGSTFKVLPRRWVVERTNAWISRRRRCARDYERLPEHHAGIPARRHHPDDPPRSQNRHNRRMITPARARVIRQAL